MLAGKIGWAGTVLVPTHTQDRVDLPLSLPAVQPGFSGDQSLTPGTLAGIKNIVSCHGENQAISSTQDGTLSPGFSHLG